MARFYDEKEPALRVIAHYEDFDGGIDKWKDSFYQLWRIQLTWDIAHSIYLRETRKRGVYVDLLIKPAYKEELLANMDDFGYKNIQTYDENVAFLSTYDRDELYDVAEIHLDY